MGEVALAVVTLLLLLGVARQFSLLGARGELFDQLALIPQWKFFGQARIGDDAAIFDDLHLIAREAGGEWRELLWWGDRPWTETFWKPHDRWQCFIGQHMADLVERERLGKAAEPTALAYLTVLRFCLDRLTVASNVQLQFAVVTTAGRDDRALAVRFLSGWHGE